MSKLVLEIGVGATAQAQLLYGTKPSLRYINIDQRVFPHVHAVVDLNDGLPFKGGAFAAIYSSHNFEHLSFATARYLLQEMHRVLERGGHFNMHMPNFAYWIEQYRQHKWTQRVRDNIFGMQLYPGDFHLSGWDPDSLVDICLETGFKAAAMDGRTADELRIFGVRIGA